MKSSLILFVLLFSLIGSSQTSNPSNDSLKLYESAPVDIYPRDYMHKYNMMKKIIVKVYPWALHSADMLDEINNNAAAIEKRRKQNKYYKDAYKDLKDEFKYSFYELTTSEGVVLMKLVHRETGMTVYEIAEKYRGKSNAEIFDVMGKLFDQDINVKYDPTGVDKIAEHVIRDIQSGLIPFDDAVVTFDKQEYKVENAKDKEQRKINHEKAQKMRHDSKLKKRQLKKDQRKND